MDDTESVLLLSYILATVDWSPNQWNLMIIVLGVWLWHHTIFISAIFSSFMMFLNTSWTLFGQSSFSVSFIPSISKLSLLNCDSIVTTLSFIYQTGARKKKKKPLSFSLTSLDCSWALTYFCWFNFNLSNHPFVLVRDLYIFVYSPQQRSWDNLGKSWYTIYLLSFYFHTYRKYNRSLTLAGAVINISRSRVCRHQKQKQQKYVFIL